MIIYDQIVSSLILESLLYALIATIVLGKGDFQTRSIRILFAYLVTAGAGGMIEALWRVEWAGFLNFNPQFLMRVSCYGVLFLALLLFQLTRAFLRLPGVAWKWWGLGAAWIAMLLAVDNNLLVLPEILWYQGQWGLDLAELTLGILLVGWGVCMAAAALVTIRGYFRTKRPLHKNRIKYWLAALLFILIGDILFFMDYGQYGNVLRLLGAFIAAYTAISHHLPDVRQMWRRVAKYLIITFIIAVIYMAGFVVIQSFFQSLFGYHPLFAGAVVALILAILFQPFLDALQSLTDRLLFGASYDPARLLNEYSARVSNIVDLQHLGTISVDIIKETLRIERGALFVVKQEVTEENKNIFRLRSVTNVEGQENLQGAMPSSNPVTQYLRQEHRPLTQYDIDLLPRFKTVAEAERAWLEELGMDVYIPIYAQGAWIGLLTLGPKLSGDRYFEEDLILLDTLAGQTAVALENARLFEDLLKLNTELTQTNDALGQANRQLQEMDKLKSSFIGVITHELRTPFANLVFSMEVLDRHGRRYLPDELQEQLDQLDTGIKSAQSMVDNLVTFATFLSKQGELQMAEVDFKQVMRDALPPFKPMAQTKNLTFHVELAKTLPPVAAADYERLRDVVYHLTHNAVKFTSEGGDIWIRCQAVDNTLQFEIQDSGVGIPADKLAVIWDSFTQMADPLRRGVEGLGLGLALVKYIITAHQGEVWAKSEAGVGSTFGFSIPLG